MDILLDDTIIIFISLYFRTFIIRWYLYYMYIREDITEECQKLADLGDPDVGDALICVAKYYVAR